MAGMAWPGWGATALAGGAAALLPLHDDALASLTAHPVNHHA